MSESNFSNFKPNKETVKQVTNSITKINYTRHNILQYLNNLPTQTKMIIVFLGILTIVLLFYYLLFKKSLVLDHVVFLKQLDNNPPKAFNTKNSTFIWKDKSGNEKQFIPSSQLKLLDYKQYTISFWIYPSGSFIKSQENGGDWSYKYGLWKHILHIGNWSDNKTTQQSPGFWLSPKLNRLNVIIDTLQEKERIVIDNLNLNTWSNVTAVLDNFSISVYINGRLEKTITLRYQPMNILDDNLWIAKKGGFAGYLAYLLVYSTPLEPDEVYNIYQYYLPKIDNWYNYNMKKSGINPIKPIPCPEKNDSGGGDDSGEGDDSGGGGNDSGGGGGGDDSGGGGDDSGGPPDPGPDTNICK